jgi:hypothetical protein
MPHLVTTPSTAGTSPTASPARPALASDAKRLRTASPGRSSRASVTASLRRGAATRVTSRGGKTVAEQYASGPGVTGAGGVLVTPERVLTGWPSPAG